MNFNVYLDDATAEKLKQLARRTGASRNALVREAIATYLARGPARWPAVVESFEGDASIQPFEATRRELAPPPGDPFAPSKPPGRARRRKRKP